MLLFSCAHHIPLSFLTFASESRVEGEEKSRKLVLRSVLFVCIFILLSTPSRPFVFCVSLVGSAHIQQLPRHISANERKFLPHFSSFACRYGNEPGVLTTTSQIMKNIKNKQKIRPRLQGGKFFIAAKWNIFLIEGIPVWNRLLSGRANDSALSPSSNENLLRQKWKSFQLSKLRKT